MDFTEILAISGEPGLYLVVAKRTDGVIAESLTDKKRKFYASRNNVFTPLENITIYTTDESVELKEVFKNMKKEKNLPDAKASNDDLRAFMLKMLPNHDQEKVYVSDIKKMIKWYQLLDANKLLDKALEADKKEKGEEKAEVSGEEPKKTAKPKKAASATKAPKKPQTNAPAKKPIANMKRGGS